MEDQLTPGRAARHRTTATAPGARRCSSCSCCWPRRRSAASSAGRELLPGVQGRRRGADVAADRELHGRGRAPPPTQVVQDLARRGRDPLWRVRREPPDAGHRQVRSCAPATYQLTTGHVPRGGVARSSRRRRPRSAKTVRLTIPPGLPPHPDRGPGGGGARDPGEDVHGAARRAATSHCRPYLPEGTADGRGLPLSRDLPDPGRRPPPTT